MMPSCDQTGTLHFHSSMIFGSACLMSARTRASVLPRQSFSSLIRASINLEGESIFLAELELGLVFFTLAVDFPHCGRQRNRPRDYFDLASFAFKNSMPAGMPWSIIDR